MKLGSKGQAVMQRRAVDHVARDAKLVPSIMCAIEAFSGLRVKVKKVRMALKGLSSSFGKNARWCR